MSFFPIKDFHFFPDWNTGIPKNILLLTSMKQNTKAEIPNQPLVYEYMYAI